jgi:hypothetical protein
MMHTSGKSRVGAFLARSGFATPIAVWLARATPLAVLVLAGCSSSGDDSSDGGLAGQGVPVYANSFENFRTWASTPGVGPPDASADTIAAADGGPHSFGPMISYINQKPLPGSTTFPVGTIIVKEATDGPLTSHKIFAMEKRGADYDPTGAVGWEWFELQNLDDSHVTFVWRGLGPPNGETYGGNPATCNDCHAGAKANDYVYTLGFSLSSF